MVWTGIKPKLIILDPAYNVVTLFGRPKLWLIWPPTKENLFVLQNMYGRDNRALRCCKNLKGGVFVVQKTGQTLLLPPYIPHATFSLGGSIICGYDFEALEVFPIMISCLDVEIRYLDNQYPNAPDRLREHKSNLENLLDGLERTLKDGSDQTKLKVVEAWITNLSTIKLAFQKVGGLESRACSIWKEFLKITVIDQCPRCPSGSGSFQDHMMHEHVNSIHIQESRMKKRPLKKG
jgi:hypothetical protein